MPGLTVFILQVGNRSMEAWLHHVGRMGIELTLEHGPPDFYFPDHDALADLPWNRKMCKDSKMQLWCQMVGI